MVPLSSPLLLISGSAHWKESVFPIAGHVSDLSASPEESYLSFFQALASKVILDMTVWSPCVTFMFPTSLGLLEGKSIKEVRHKVAMVCSP